MATGVIHRSLPAATDESVASRGERRVVSIARRHASSGAAADVSLVDRDCAWCRQAAFRIRRRHQVEARNSLPMRMAYADPPYPGYAWMYADQPEFAGEVDHRALAGRPCLCLGEADRHKRGDVRPPQHVGAGNRRARRELRPGKRDWIAAQPARRGGDLIGRKPEAFATWLFGLLGLLPGDQFEDLFLGSGIISRAWSEVCRAAG